MKKFLLCINRDIFKMLPQIFLLNYKRLKKEFFSIFPQVLGSRTEAGVR